MTSVWRTSGWVLVGAALILALSLGVRHGFGLFLAPMSADFGWGREVFAFAIALQNLIWGLAQPFAGALAARTSRARLGFAVIQMALHHPVRLAIQLAVLDNLSRGRLDVGIGRGSSYNEYEYVGFGLRSNDSRERLEEALQVLIGAWTQEPFVHDGKFFSVRLPAVRPRPVQRPHPPIWRSVKVIMPPVASGVRASFR